jgi:hypothetical protein
MLRLFKDERGIDIKGYEGLYAVTSDGRFISYPKIGRQAREIKQFTNHDGYQLVFLCKNAVCRAYIAHRLVAKAFIPNPLNLPQINHIDGIKANNDISNLEWCTQAYNIQHAVRTGLKPSYHGEHIGTSKLKEAQVRTILKLKGEQSQRSIARDFGVSQTTVRYIHQGRSWAWIK